MEKTTSAVSGTKEKLFNIPPVTFWLLAIFTLIQLIRIASENADAFLVTHLVFVPRDFTNSPVTEFYRLLGYGFLHFGWLHFFVNMTGFAAFGSGIERIMGKSWLITILLIGIIIGAFGQWAIFPHIDIPLGGASAGISALFGALIPFIMPRRAIKSAVAIFIAMNIVVGMMGVPDEPGLSIAWQAHIAGFLFGLAIGFFNTRATEINHPSEKNLT